MNQSVNLRQHKDKIIISICTAILFRQFVVAMDIFKTLKFNFRYPTFTQLAEYNDILLSLYSVLFLPENFIISTMSEVFILRLS